MFVLSRLDDKDKPVHNDNEEPKLERGVKLMVLEA